ncbi:hypothetical protein DFA_09921 [Cavenderia fasciculata]|uniref:Peptidase S28 family protein n=1 Tax=Cavenderia fasciculata TaxID=261658 RepID=F4Q8S8_CACFS|nr:uncharacterized protein DFA_09921 [Cavenderia fasciculata]EGG15097.1 hypothetical protein DFA_09921 [Cavenderia fasciculata]|eukprot:XP_004351817.1 hypothetical protein DFA_09921 [Cavenderia fasciculata]
MNRTILLLLLFLCIFSNINSAHGRRSASFRPHRDLSIYHQLSDEKLLPSSDQELISKIDYEWFTQSVDHFDSANQKKFQQRYLVNDHFWDGKGPVFMMINGEGPMSLGAVTGLQYVVWAKEVHALIVSLEHRYYGASFVTDNLATENLIYLTPQQALADNAVFRDFIANTYSVPQTSKWVSFGGSYSGCLSSWFRIKYPNLVDYAIASSAPVNPVIDFYQYLEVVQNALLTTSNGQQCVDRIKQSTQKIQDLLKQPNGLKTVSELFSLDPVLKTDDDISNFMQSLAGTFMGDTQYNLIEGPFKSVEALCLIMNNYSNDSLTNYIQIWNNAQKGELVDVSYQSMIQEYANITNDDTNVGGRQWFFQTCTQFGYYQSSTSNNHPFGHLFEIDFQIKQCTDIFGFAFLPNVNWTILEYGGLDPSASNIMYINGDIDPWHALGILDPKPASSSIQTLLIHGAAHTADMYIPRLFTPSTIAPAQKIIFKYLSDFLNNVNQ